MVTSIALINTAMVTSSSIPGNAASPKPRRLSQGATHYVICATLVAGVRREKGPRSAMGSGESATSRKVLALEIPNPIIDWKRPFSRDEDHAMTR
jgi:hypothetical protein